MMPRTLTTLRALWLLSGGRLRRRRFRMSPPRVYRLIVIQVDVVIVPIVDDPILYQFNVGNEVRRANSADIASCMITGCPRILRSRPRSCPKRTSLRAEILLLSLVGRGAAMVTVVPKKIVRSEGRKPTSHLRPRKELPFPSKGPFDGKGWTFPMRDPKAVSTDRNPVYKHVLSFHARWWTGYT